MERGKHHLRLPLFSWWKINKVDTGSSYYPGFVWDNIHQLKKRTSRDGDRGGARSGFTHDMLVELLVAVVQLVLLEVLVLVCLCDDVEAARRI